MHNIIKLVHQFNPLMLADVTICLHIRQAETAGKHIHQHNHIFNLILCKF